MAEAKDQSLLPLTTDNICTELHGVNVNGLGVWLRVPYRKLHEIKQRHSTQANQTRAIIEYWLSVDPTPSWRRLVWALEGSNQHQLVIRVKPHVEPLIDPSLTAEKVSSALETVTDWKKVYFILGVPRGLVEREQSTASQTAVNWWLWYSPTASWAWLAGRLYSSEERTALETVSKYIHKNTTGSTLNPTNLFSALSSVRNWWDELPIGLHFELQIPKSVAEEIQEQTSDATQQKKTLIKQWLRDHPAPSWAVVAEALYKVEEHGVLEQVKTKYITGVKSLVSCCLSVVVGSEQLMVQLPSLPHRLQHQIKNTHVTKFSC